MTKENNIKNLVQLNIALLFMATSGALARYIEMPVILLICFRAIVAGIIIFLFCKWKGFNLKVEKKDWIKIILSGLFMGAHWVTYFYSLRLSNVAIGMISLFTFPVITTFLEPLILKSKFQRIQIFLGLMALVGVYFLVPEFSFQNEYFIAICVGIVSAVMFSLRNIISKSIVSSYNGSVIMMYQLFIVGFILLPAYWIYEGVDIVGQLPAALILALVTTAIGHTMFLYSLKSFSATSVSIISSSQPVYGILIGMLLLKEIPDSNAVIGGIIILSTVIIENLGSHRKKIIGFILKKRA